MGKSLNAEEAEEVVQNFLDLLEDYAKPYVNAIDDYLQFSPYEGYFVTIHHDGIYIEYAPDDDGFNSSVRLPWSLFADFAGTMRKAEEVKRQIVEDRMKQGTERDKALYLQLKERFESVV